MNTIDYNKQADNFLSLTNANFSCSYWKHARYFPDDKESRDVWYITLKNANHRYRFQFGQSIANEGKAPSPYDVLACLTKSDPGSFEEFCSGFGYSTDSKKAEKTYKAVLNEWDNINKLYSDSEIELLQEIN